MSCVTLLRTGLLFFSILISGEASPCQQKRDAPLDLFGDDVLDDGSFTLAFGTSTDGDVLSSENSYPGVSIFSNSIDGLGSAAVDSFIQTSNPDSQMDFASDGGNQDVAGLSFSGINLEGVSGEDLLAQLPDFGGITDFSFKDLENGNEKSCPADGNTATQTEQEKFPGLSEQTTMYSDLSPEDKRKCPSINGKQPVALCCFGAYFPEKSIQAGCHRRTYRISPLLSGAGILQCAFFSPSFFSLFFFSPFRFKIQNYPKKSRVEQS